MGSISLTIMIVTMYSLIVLVLSSVPIQAAEWMTSGGNHCIEKCRPGTRKGLDLVMHCSVVDGETTEFRPGGVHEEGSGEEEEESGDDEDKVMWDYCTRAPMETLETGDGYDEAVEPVGLPDKVDGSNRQTGSGDSNFNPGSRGKTESSLAGVFCDGACTENFGGRYTCDVPGKNPNNFFCSPDLPLQREQLTSHNKLWCISDCLRWPGDQHYKCKTLHGHDLCSPHKDKSSTGQVCSSPCQPNYDVPDQHYQCTVNKTTKEDCGYWYVATAKKAALEYTNNDQVCAGPCLDTDGDLVCSYVQWQWSESSSVSLLHLLQGPCGGVPGRSVWQEVLIVVGCVLGALLVILLIAVYVGRTKYSPTATTEY